jgi:hypothetical protein
MGNVMAGLVEKKSSADASSLRGANDINNFALSAPGG